MYSHPHKPIFYPSNFYDRSNAIRLTWILNQVKDHTTQSSLECHKDADRAIILNRRSSVSGIPHTMLGVSVCFKVQIQPYIASDPTGG